MKFDSERDWYRREHDRDLALIANLRAPFEDDERPSDGTGESQESDGSVYSWSGVSIA